MMKVLQINTTLTSGSTGRLASGIGDFMMKHGHQSYIAYSRKSSETESHEIKIGNKIDFYLHVLKTRLGDRHGFGSKSSTEGLVEKINLISPDIIHLHNIHGYFINVEILFKYLKNAHIPVVWTFHDCWPFTGHCSYFDAVNCYKWTSSCSKCPNKRAYPSSWLLDNSRRNYIEKRNLFTSIETMILVSPSKWLADHLQKSILKQYEVRIINNGIDVNLFRPLSNNNIKAKYNLTNKKIVLGVANIWDKRKGLQDFVKLRSLLKPEIVIVLVGLTPDQIKDLPLGIVGLPRSETINDLVSLYSAADVFANPTYVDNFPTTNLEAQGCGTPVVTYNTGGCFETISELSGKVVNKGDHAELGSAIIEILQKGKEKYSNSCRAHALKSFDKSTRFQDYLDLYNSLL